MIQDFKYGLDNLQLHGAAADYQQVQQVNDVHLTRNDDLVAILENTSTLNIKIAAFDYINTYLIATRKRNRKKHKHFWNKIRIA